MSTPDDSPFSIVQQEVMISADLNSTLLYQFFFGIYTGVFPATLYIYIRKENRTRARDMIIIGNSTALYFVSALHILLNWLYTNIPFGTRAGTRLEIFMESTSQVIPLGQRILDDLTTFAVFVFADGLLVWRCFHLCGRSFLRSLIPIMLLTVETVLALTSTAYNCLLHAKPDFRTIQAIEISNRLVAATFVSVAATSLVSTVVICLQIWQHTSLSSRSRKRYQTIINALIESSALYTISIIFVAILYFADTGNLERSFTIIRITEFVNSATQVISGLAPTLMIARLVVSSSQEDTEVSSARLPSDLICRASHASHINMTNVSGPDLEMQPTRLIGVGEQESEEIQMVTRTKCQLKDEVENRPETLV